VRVYVEPTVVLVSTKIDDAVIDRFDPQARGEGSESGHSELVLSHLGPYLIKERQSAFSA
jgi:DNA mismatch repair protein MSH5